MRIDLHTHTIGSDGKQTVFDLINKAESAGVEVLVITDHEFMYPEDFAARDAAKKGITLLHGVELVFSWNGEVNEVLGYLPNYAKLKPFIEKAQKKKNLDEIESLKSMHAEFTRKGFKLSPLEKLLSKLEGKNNRAGEVLFADIYARTENSGLIAKYEMEPSKGIYNKYLNNKLSPLYFKDSREFPTLEEVSDALRKSGAHVFMAHPLHYRNTEEWGKAMLDYAVENKLINGVEVYHRCHKPSQIKYLQEFAKKHKLLISGGTDNHYLEKPLGIMNNGTMLTDAEMPWLKKLLK